MVSSDSSDFFVVNPTPTTLFYIKSTYHYSDMQLSSRKIISPCPPKDPLCFQPMGLQHSLVLNCQMFLRNRLVSLQVALEDVSASELLPFGC